MAGGDACSLRGHGLAGDEFGFGRVFAQPLGQLFVGGLFDHRAHGHVAELALGLALELGLTQPHADDGGEAFADVFALEAIVFALFEDVAFERVTVHHVSQGLAEALFVHAALSGRDAVGEAVQAVAVEAGVPLERDFDFLFFFFGFEVADVVEQGFFGRVDVLDEVADAAVVAEDLRFVGLGGVAFFEAAQVTEVNLEALVQERHHLQSLEQRLGSEGGFFENRAVGPEPHGRTGSVIGRIADDLE